MKKRIIIVLISILLVVPVSPLWASGLPVFDFSSFIQLLTLVRKTTEQMAQLRRQVTELESIKKQNEKQSQFFERTLRGNFGYGKLLNDENYLKRRLWSQNNWSDMLNASSGNPAYREAERRYQNLYPVLSENEVFTTRKRNSLNRTYYQQSSKVSRTALAASSYSYDQINEHIKNLHDMVEKLESEQSEKAAIDLNARLVAELGFIQLEMLRQQNIQTQLLATQVQGEVNGMSEQANFLRSNK